MEERFGPLTRIPVPNKVARAVPRSVSNTTWATVTDLAEELPEISATVSRRTKAVHRRAKHANELAGSNYENLFRNV